MDIRKLLVTATLCASANLSFGQTQNFNYSDQEPINIGTTLSFHSEVLGEEKAILVSLPEGYESSSKRYPVIYLLDAQELFMFRYAHGLISYLTVSEEIPEVILVGVASEDRDRDMTPPSEDGEGRADNFLDFFRRELHVFIDQQYRTEPYKVLIGHSLGGLFALHTLFNAPDTFNAYIGVSPAVWLDNGSVWDEMRGNLSTSKSFKNSLFTSLTPDENGRMREIYDEFVETLTEARFTGLGFETAYFPDEDHGSTVIPGMRQGLQSIYRDWKLPESTSNLEELLSHHRNLSENYGYTGAAPIDDFYDVGVKLVRSGDPAAALEIFEYSYSNISQDALAHFHLGYALSGLGRLSESLSEFEKAIELGPEIDITPGTYMYGAFIQLRDGVVKKISEQEELVE